MASWFDIFVFVLTASAFVGAIIGVRFIANQISSTVSATKESLKSRGLTISDKGVSVRTSSRYSREDYVDATQRGFIKAMGASSFSASENGNSPGVAGQGASNKATPVLERHNSSASFNSTGSGQSSAEKKKRRFGLKKRNSES